METDPREAGECEARALIRLGSPGNRSVADTFLDGALEVQSARGVRGPERVLLEALGLLTPGRILDVGSREGVVALAVARLFPDAEVHWLTLDAYEYRRASQTFHENPTGNLWSHLGADLPVPGGFDRVLFPASRKGDARLTGEILREALDALKDRGLLLAATDDSRDRWLHGKILDMFGSATIHARSRGGVAYAARKKAGHRARRRDFRRTFSARLLGMELKLETRPGVFSHGRLDQGTLALSEVACLEKTTRVLEMGCGAGALGIGAALVATEGFAVLVDSSPRAVQVSRRNAHANGASDNTLVLLGVDLSAIREGAIDLVLANPPYFGDFRIAEMFATEAHRVLSPGGELLLVAKASDRPGQIIQRLFGNHEITSRRGYAVIRGKKRP